MGKSTVLARILSLSLTLAMVGQTVAFGAGDVLTGDVRITVTPANVQETATIPGANRTVNMSFHGVAVQDALRALAKKGGFNVLIDESVQGDISVDLKNVTLQQALETFKTYANLAYSVEGSNLMVADASSEKGQSFSRNVTRIIPLRYANARVIADLLNTTVFPNVQGAGGGGAAAAAGAGGAVAGPVTADFHTNSLVVVGSKSQVKAVMEHVEALDQPREMKTWRLSHSNVLDVATLLASSLFNEGQPVLISGGSAAGAALNGPGSLPSTLRVVEENIEEGQGASTAQTTGGSGGGSQGIVQQLTLRARVKENATIQISPNGPILIPDTRLNTLTLLGTAEQIAMAEAMIPNVDRKLPQVIIEASLVEISEAGQKELGFSSGFEWRWFDYGSNNDPTSTVPQRQLQGPFSDIGIASNAPSNFRNVLEWTSINNYRPFRMNYQINNLVKNQKAKILASPTIVLTHDAEGVISIVDEIIRSVTVTVGANNGAPQFETEIGEAGIIMTLLPRIGADGTVNMRVRPTVSTVVGTEVDRNGNLITLLSRREILNQNIVLRDGETFVLGGLISDTNTEIVRRDPFLSRLPILGALARNSIRQKEKNELVLMLTPHIVNDESEVARGHRTQPMQPAVISKGQPSAQERGIIPVSESGFKYTPSALPPLQKPNVIGDDHGAIGNLSNSRREIKPQPLNPDELAPAAALIKPEKVQQSTPAWTKPATPAAKPVEKPQAPEPQKPQDKADVAPLEEITDLKANNTPSAPKEPTMALRPESRTPKSTGEITDNTIREIMERFK